jgi:DNA-binding NarL/FixJ family response regulator
MADLMTLTRRETEVLALVAAGKRNTEVARALCIEVQTVEVHLKHIYSKLHVRSRTEAAGWYWRLQQSHQPKHTRFPGRPSAE